MLSKKYKNYKPEHICSATADDYRQVIVHSFELLDNAKDIAGDDEELFGAMLTMVTEYQQVAFKKFGSA